MHLKAGCRDSAPDSRRPACRTLLRQIAIVADWILERQDEGEAFAVLGDFNRLLAPDDPAFHTLAASGPLALVTAGRASPARRAVISSTISLWGPAYAWVRPDSLRVMLYHEDSGTEAPACPITARYPSICPCPEAGAYSGQMPESCMALTPTISTIITNTTAPISWNSSL
ncbi:hypothetical protein RAA17_07495 [Komagataeibacter rhaeticus]|nr:hypothetical protein [Komagataeibacter rhaeticus]